MTLLLREEGKLLYLSGKGEKTVFLMVLARLWPQTWQLGNLMPLDELAKFLSEEPSSLFSISPPYFQVLWLTW